MIQKWEVECRCSHHVLWMSSGLLCNASIITAGTFFPVLTLTNSQQCVLGGLLPALSCWPLCCWPLVSQRFKCIEMHGKHKTVTKESSSLISWGCERTFCIMSVCLQCTPEMLTCTPPPPLHILKSACPAVTLLRRSACNHRKKTSASSENSPEILRWWCRTSEHRMTARYQGDIQHS